MAAEKLHGASCQLWLLLQDSQKSKSVPAFINGEMHAGRSLVAILLGATNQEAQTSNPSSTGIDINFSIHPQGAASTESL